jgi:hypothetical protein
MDENRTVKANDSGLVTLVCQLMVVITFIISAKKG